MTEQPPRRDGQTANPTRTQVTDDPTEQDRQAADAEVREVTENARLRKTPHETEQSPEQP
ncbi:hypothetical protein [Amycolatopsis sp. NPDC051371]|uniref:hypothetical protein n=1 Tax=Amycolatopsis sp. NPDC051371 TaxID=3155800 RepID=UPI00341B0FB9